MVAKLIVLARARISDVTLSWATLKMTAAVWRWMSPPCVKAGRTRDRRRDARADAARPASNRPSAAPLRARRRRPGEWLPRAVCAPECSGGLDRRTITDPSPLQPG